MTYGKSPGPRFFFVAYLPNLHCVLEVRPPQSGLFSPSLQMEGHGALKKWSNINGQLGLIHPVTVTTRRTTQPIWLVVSNIFLCLPRMFGEIISNLRTAHVFSEGLNKKHQLDSDCTDFLVLLGEL